MIDRSESQLINLEARNRQRAEDAKRQREIQVPEPIEADVAPIDDVAPPRRAAQ